jgi:hypothetical protein
MQALFLPRPAWLLTGSLMGWGDPLIPLFDLVVFLTLDPQIRLARLTARETIRHDAALPEPGGERHEAHKAFLRWAHRYDDPTFTGRSRIRHEDWLTRIPCPVLHLDSSAPVDALVSAVRAHTAAGDGSAGA